MHIPPHTHAHTQTHIYYAAEYGILFRHLLTLCFLFLTQNQDFYQHFFTQGLEF